MESKNLEGYLVTLPLFFQWLLNQEMIVNIVPRNKKNVAIICDRGHVVKLVQDIRSNAVM